MKCTSIVGLCLAAMVASGAMAASSAYAGEYGVCLKTARVKEGKVSHYTGKWKDKACESEQQTNGEYEWWPGRTALEPIPQRGVRKQDFEFRSISKAAVLSSAAGTIKCNTSFGVGEILGEQYNVERAVFKGCSLNVTKGKCMGVEDPELKEGEIPVFSDTYLIDHGTKGSGGLEPKELEVWNAYFATEGYPYYPYRAIFVCNPGVIFRVGGQVSGVVSRVSEMMNNWKVTFGAGIGEQDLVTEYSENGGLTWKPTGPNVFTFTAWYDTWDDSKIEIRQCNEIGAVSEGKGAFPCENEELPLPWEP